jgi:hypothetical protein
MTISARRTEFFANLRPIRTLRWVFAAAAVAAAVGARTAQPGAFDGVWNVQFATHAGNCSSTNSVPFTVTGRRVSSAGGGKVTGGISPSGAVSVNISVGASKASGSGRLAGNSGSGRWTGIIEGDRCSGSWQASR